MIPPRYAIDASDIRFRYRSELPLVLDIPHWQVNQGQHTFLHGPSGSGKTTLLGLVAGILNLQAGQLRVLGEDFSKLSLRSRDQLRGEHLGYIFQMFNLIPYLSVRENICLPCKLAPGRADRIKGDLNLAATELAERLGIAAWLDRAVTDLSVGQQQRVAAARALLGAPELIIADEPTSALDADHRAAFIKLLFDEAARSGSTILFVSHDHSLSSLFDTKVSLRELNRVPGVAL
jgi:putative ABC transport system ATP-binding protein